MPFDIATHKTILFQILKDIYTDTTVSPFLGFKGGTAAVMFYGLDRFSVDLDFDLLDENQEDLTYTRLIEIAGQYGLVREARRKRFNIFILLSYEDKSRNLKIEVNRRQFGSRFEIKTYLGVSMQVMVIEDMFAHKLVAMSERMEKTSRDIYDVWYFLNSRYPINKKIVETRSQMPFNQFIEQCISQLSIVKNRHILTGLGELLTTNRKDRARAKLLPETIALLELRKEISG